MIPPPAPASDSTFALVPGERFFTKEIILDPAVDAAAQVELGLEQSSPFPLLQLFHGFVASPDGRQALAFASYRRRFTAEEMAAWPAATAVVPEFIGLIGPPPERPLVVVVADAAGLNGVAWDGRAGLPVAVMARSIAAPAESHITEMMTELRLRLGREDVEVRRLAGPVGVGRDEAGAAVFRIGGEQTARFPAEAVANADVRDKSFLDEKRRDDQRRRGWTWALAATAALFFAALGLELAADGLGLWNRRQEAVLSGRAGEVARIETAQTLALRIEDLAARPEKPLEWLSLVGAARPRSVQFLRVVSGNNRSLTIEAQTADAAAVGAYESALRQRDGLEEVEVRDIRSREGLTSFVLALRFKPAGGGAAGGAP